MCPARPGRAARGRRRRRAAARSPSADGGCRSGLTGSRRRCGGTRRRGRDRRPRPDRNRPRRRVPRRRTVRTASCSARVLPEHSNATGIPSGPCSRLSRSATSSPAASIGTSPSDFAIASRWGEPVDAYTVVAPVARATCARMRPTGPQPKTTAGAPRAAPRRTRPRSRRSAASARGPRRPRTTAPPADAARARRRRASDVNSVWRHLPYTRVPGGTSRVAARDDRSRCAVAEHDRVILRRRAGDEDAELGVPGLVQVRVACVASDVRHLRPGTDHRDLGPHAHHRRRERTERIDVALDGAGLGDPDGAAADLAALRELVARVLTPRPASAIFDRTYCTDGGSTASASPESDASSNDA